MDFTIGIIIAAVLALGIVFFVVKRAVRLAFRMALLGALLFVLLVGGLLAWWFTRSSSTPSREARPTNSRPIRAR
jgi:uncharacterized membrane protein (UPF0182 family)